MHVILLGTAAGGGFPQWNCWCPVCRIARRDPEAAHPRSQSSVAVSADGRHWFLVNASPDVRDQLSHLPSDIPAGNRHVPIEGVITTDAELDHTMGLALLREGRRLQFWSTAAVREVLEEDSRLLPVTRAFAEVQWHELPLGRPVQMTNRDAAPSGLTIEAFSVAGDPPRFARHERAGHTVGLDIRASNGVRCLFIPGCGAVDEEIKARLTGAALLLFDGTFWAEDELIGLGISDRPAAAMGHLPINGPGGSLARLEALAPPRRVYTHINNSNPVLIEDSPERRTVEAAGWVVGDDGMRFEL
ncbi:MAG: pyrroloquinoline quinone biosynthesis protein PqqB [Gemmatimonadota bacterium]